MFNIKTGIYQIILKRDGRSYIGSAKNIEARWNKHIHNAFNKNLKVKQVICKAIEKYGKDSFDWIILEECSEDQLINREQYWLDKIKPFTDYNNGFNVRKIAKSNIGIKRSEESRKKQSNSMKGVPKTEEHKKNMSKSWYKHRGEEYYRAASERIKGEKNPACRPEVKEKISKSMTGKTWKHDEERMKKHKDRLRNRKYTNEQRKRMSIAQQKNKTRSEQAKEKFSIARRVLYEITTPNGEKFSLYSKELKVFCEENSLSYTNLITNAKTNKPYKKVWFAKIIKNNV